MSKKTCKKSSESATGRSTGKPAGAKARVATRVAAKKPLASATSKPSKKAAAKAPKRSGAKTATTRVSTASGTLSKAPKKPVIPKNAALNEGDFAPAFSLPRDGGQVVSLADYTGRKLVIFFYPRANTPGCTLEAIAFSRLAAAFAAAQTAVLGVSADPVTAQEAFRDKHELTVPLVSDEKLGMLEAYGVWGEKSMYGKTFMGIARTTVLVGPNGKVARIWRNVRVNGHADEVLEAARAV